MSGEKRPFAKGTLSIGLYTYGESDAVTTVDRLLGHARLSEEFGFDGITLSEHHRGREGYMPNPLQVASWFLDVTNDAWSAPLPMILTMRSPAVVAEEIAWLSARFPGRVAAGFVRGADDLDFRAASMSFEVATGGYRCGLRRTAALLSGGDQELLGTDRAIRSCRDRPIPLASGSLTIAGSRTAASCHVGLVTNGNLWLRRDLDRFTPAEPVDPVSILNKAYLAAGGDGPRILICPTWVGRIPEDTLERYRRRQRAGSVPSGFTAYSSGEGLLYTGEPEAIAESLSRNLDHVDCFNFRIPYHGVSHAMATEQIKLIGTEVLPLLRHRIELRSSE